MDIFSQSFTALSFSLFINNCVVNTLTLRFLLNSLLINKQNLGKTRPNIRDKFLVPFFSGDLEVTL